MHFPSKGCDKMRHIIFICLLALSACALPVTDVPQASYNDIKSETRKETGDILAKYITAQQRLLAAAGPIWMANAQFCPRRAFTTGFIVYSDFDVPDGLRDVAYERLLLNGDAKVLAVFPGSEAWNKNVRSGDTLLTMDGKRVRNAAEARARLRRIKEPRTVNFGFIRDGRAFDAAFTLSEMCNYPITYLEGKREVNAAADGRRIYFTQGMVDFTNDRELAIAIGHELAHNIMHHIPKEKVNAIGVTLAGTLIDGMTQVVGLDTDASEVLYTAYTQMWSKEFEKEADYVGLYLAARAGADMSVAAPFWRKMAAEHGLDSVSLPAYSLRTHPDSPERFAILEKAKTEIEDKIRRREPLVPNLKFGFAWGQKFWPWEQTYPADEEPDDTDLNH